MNFTKAICAVIAVILLCTGAAFAQSSSQGKEFWTGYMLHNNPPTTDGNGSKMSLYITGDVATTGKVEIADGTFSTEFTVTPKQTTIINVPASAYLNRSGRSLKGIHITAKNNIAVYAHIYYNSVSGATLLIPVNVMGKNYYSINYAQAANQTAYSTFMVIATEDNTTIEVTPSGKLNSNRKAYVPFTVELKKGEVYQDMSKSDLTHTIIKSISNSSGGCKKIAVFSGSSKIGIGCDEQPNPGNFSSDNLFQQVYPISSWGKKYITVPLKNRNYDIYRVVFSDDSTNLYINGQKIPLEAPDFFEFESSVPNVISADKPIQVVQYAVTQGEVRDTCAYDVKDYGDPEMIYLTPLEQTLDHVTLYSAPYAHILYSYVNVVMKTEAVATLSVDGTAVSGFASVPGNDAYSYVQIPVSQGTHNLSASDGFNAIAYGFGNFESYGYAAGASLKNLNQYISLGDKTGNKSYIKGCVGIDYKLQMVLPYMTTNIQWYLPGSAQPVTDSNPQVKATMQRDGKTLYTYEYKDLLKFDLGDYHVMATVLNPVADECGATTDIDFDFNIIDFPKADFSIAASCAGDTTSFIDKSDLKNANSKTWLWDFGDGTTSNLQNPKHVFEPGTYTVALTIGNENDCTDIKTTEVIIAKKPVADFAVEMPSCTYGVTFTDHSTIETGKITQWIWNFGDGTDPEIHMDDKPVTHVYNKANSYKVSLTVANSTGCTSNITVKDVFVHPSPAVDFILPDICLEDGTAHFTNKTTIEDHTENSLKYLWAFGDANATASNPNTSAQKDPDHKYSAVGNYQITLTVTSNNGCSVTKTGTLTVNGDIPQAKFTVHDQQSLCSANQVIFTDESAPTFGNVTRVVWLFDYANHPADSVVYDRADIPADRTFSHDYGLFNTPATKTFNVRMIAYSGQSCSAITNSDILVHANPVINVAQIGTICHGADPVQIAVDKKDYAGTGIFSGRGVTTNGLFRPAVSGVGNTTITYTFTAENGCDYVATQVIKVNADPLVDAGENFTILEGDKTILKGKASEGIYKWTPAIGLDADNTLNPTVEPTETTTYTLTVTNADGCPKSDNVVVTVLKKPVVVNAFTPNGDGTNDTWKIKYLDTYPGNTVDIYNRNGEKVYSSVGYAIEWDGTFQGKALPAGTYYYIINPKNGRKVIAGNVTIIR